jgi:hypothetical protein
MNQPAEDCGCGKPKPGPLGGGKPPRSLVASSTPRPAIYVAPNGQRTAMDDLAARAEARRGGGRVEFP